MTDDASRIDLTSAQRGIWYAQKIEPDNPTFQIGLYVDIRGPLDVNVMRRAVATAVAEADSLNVIFGEDDTGAFQQHGPARSHLRVHDLRGGPDDDPAASARAMMDDDLGTVHDLEDGELLRSELFHLGTDHWIFYQRAHHLLVDGYSAILVLRRESEIYSQLASPAGGVSQSPFGSLEDVIAEEADYRSSDRFGSDAEFWTQTLAESEAATGLAGHPPTTARRLVAATAEMPQDLARGLTRTRSTPALLLSAAAAYLHRMTGRQNISVGLPVTARRSALAKSVPSMMSKILPVQLHITGETTVDELVGAAGSALRETLVHQRFQYQELDTGTDYIGPSVNIFPPVDDIDFGAASASLHLLSTGPVDDLSIIIHGLGADQQSGAGEGRNALVRFEANAELYDHQSLSEHLRQFISVLSQLDLTAAQPVAELSLIDDAESAELIAGGQGRTRDVPGHSVVEEFIAHARRSPLSTAVVAADGKMSFGELDRRSTQLACHLRDHGARPGTRIAARLSRTTTLPVAVLGVLKAGAAFVPLDPDYPAARIEAMVSDAAPLLVLNSSSVTGPAGEATVTTDVPLIDLDSEQLWAELSATSPQTSPGTTPGSDDLAYVIFTSGSTGRPKGIGVEHQSLLNLLHSHVETIFAPAAQRLGRSLRVAHTAGISFDASWDPLLWLFAGHELHLIDSLTRRDPEALTEYFTAHVIDSVETTPSFVKALLAHGTFSGDDHPSVVALGGEAVEGGLWRELAALEDVAFYNLYGPAETTVDSLTAPIVSDTAPVLGHSVANTRHYVLDSRLSPVPAQARGELYIAGRNLARGYVDRPATTSERFIADPFADDGSRMYRTGDIVRRSLSGGIEFLGRGDEQIKLRGYRVETSEVELVLQADERVRSAAVVLGRNQAGYDQLLGYITGSGEIDVAEVRRSMKSRVPDYMVPSFIMRIERIPLTVNGKLDRRALPEPESSQTGSEAPRDATEQAVAAAFSHVLGVKSIGIDDDFFELGGHSLLATQLIASLRTSFAAAPALHEVFQHPTVRELSSTLDPQADPANPGLDLVAADRPSSVPLSYAQSRLWFLNQLDTTSAAYNIPLTLRLRGHLDSAALHAGINDLVARHESLRTVYPWTAGTPEQVTLAAEDTSIAMPTVEIGEDLVDATVTAEATRGFDISGELPIRALLIRLGDDDHLLLLTLHHIAADGWSLRPLAHDLSTAYRARSRGDAPAFTPLPVQYADYALWQREALGAEDDPDSAIADQLAFWKDTLTGAPLKLRLPVDRARSTRAGDHVSRTVAIEIGSAEHAGLRRLAADRNASLFMVLQAAFAVLLDKLGAGSDIPIGTPVAGRTETKLDELIGFFVNTVVLRTDTSGNPSPVDVIDRVRAFNLGAYANQDAPFERVVDEVGPPRAESLHPLFQVMLTLQNTAPVDIDMGSLDAAAAPGPDVSEAKFDLLLDLAERESQDGEHGDGEAPGVLGSLEYDSALFDESTAQDIATWFLRVIEAFVAGPDSPVSELGILSPLELDTIREQSRGPERAPVESTIIDMFESTVADRPDSPALVSDCTALTFAELGSLVSALGRGLVRRGITRGDKVAIALPRSADAIAVPLAVLRIGAIAVPIDLSYPQERIRLILDESAADAVIVDPSDVSLRPDTAITITELHDEHAEDRRGDAAAVRGTEGDTLGRPEPADRAYEMYTSGSTGTPKGVAVTHRSLMNLFAHHRETIFAEAGLDETPVKAAHTAGLGFDAAWDPVLWLVAGANLHIVGDEVRRDAEALVQYVHAHQITVLETTPSFLRQLITSGLFDAEPDSAPAPLSIALGGEAVPDELWAELADTAGVNAHNFYGPTEFTIDSVTAAVEGEQTTIGHPIRNVQAMVLDRHLNEVPHGVVGDLYLAGAGITTGYVNRARETAQRFVANPFGGGERMYRTGDLVRRTADGGLDFIARDDDQIKLRGYRIELGEVENALATAPGVEQAAAVVDSPQDPPSARLIGYYTGDAEESTVHDHLADRLPAPMVPRLLVALDSIPLTAHGKLDRGRLPVPAPAGGQSPLRTAGTPEEASMCRQFSAVLGAEQVGLDDDFFELGGHSLLAVSLIGRIRDAFDTDLPLRAIFDAPTPAALLRRLDAPGHTSQAPREEATPAPTRNDNAAALSLSKWKQTALSTRPQRIPLSYGQARMHFLNRLDPTASDYNISLAVRFAGDLDPEALGAALENVIARHEILRTVYPTLDDTPVQHILPPAAGRGLMGHEVTATPTATAEALTGQAGLGFDLSTELPLRATLFTEGEEWVLHLVLHHIATDGASLRPLTQDLSTAYAALRGSAHPMQRTLDVQYADFALWQRHILEGPNTSGAQETGEQASDEHTSGEHTSAEHPSAEHASGEPATAPASLLEHKLGIWRDRLEGIPTELPLPSDRPRPRTARQPGRHHHFNLGERTTQRLSAIAADSGASLFMALHAVLAGFLGRLAGSEDIVIGSPSAGRLDPELEDIVGLFVNTVPIRSDISGEPDLRTLLARTRTTVIDALELDDVPFERLVESLNPARELGRHPLFQTMLSLESSASPALELPGVDTSIEPEVETGDAKFDLSFTFRQTAQNPELDVVLDYNSAMFDSDAIAEVCAMFSRFVAEAVDAPERPIHDISLLAPAEVDRAIEVLTGPAPTTSAPHILDVFASTVDRLPDATALEQAGTALSFRELDAAADRLADELSDCGAGPGAVVSVRLSRGVGIIVSTLAVLKSGAVYNPIDIDYPVGRTTAILADAAPTIVVAETGTLTTLAPVLDDAGICPSVIEVSPVTGAVDAAAPSSSSRSSSSRSQSCRSQSPAAPSRDERTDPSAYVTFTSGSTGRPKGVEVGHRGLANLLASHRDTYLPTPANGAEQVAVAHTTGIGFDAAWDPILWMITGHRLHIASEQVQRDPQQLASSLLDLSIGFWETTPSYLRQLKTEPDFLRRLDEAAAAGTTVTVALGGEALDADLWEWLREQPGITAHNLYGPTETTVDVFAAPLASSPTPVLGSPLTHMRGYVLDERLHHVPAGTTGELYLAGPQLAHGYRGRPVRSAERFVADPFGAAGERMYRTGDLVVRHRSGQLSFIGRSDSQIQLRGFRVELGEVERTLRSAAGVKDAIVRPSGDDPASMQLIGYIIADLVEAGDRAETDDRVDTADPARSTDQGQEALADETRRHARSVLPTYMVPTRIVVIDEVPLTTHGKVDEAALPDPAAAAIGSRLTPRTPQEETVATIFARVLSLPRVGVDESFFELGGHSFLARPLIAAVNDALGSELSVQSLFRSPTVEQLAVEAAQGRADSVDDSLRPLLPLRTAGTKSPLFAVHPATGISWGFASMLQGLDAQRPLIGLQMPGLAPDDPDEITADTLTELADDYIAGMRSVQPAGPYHLIGWSFGGVLAHRLATRLQEWGEDVAFLGVLDAFPTGQESNAEVGEGAALWANYLDTHYPGATAETEGLDDAHALEFLRKQGDPLGNVSSDTIASMTRGFLTVARLIREAPIVRFDGDLSLFVATRDVPRETPAPESWRPYVTADIHVTDVPARHSDMLTAEALEEILPVMAIQLEEHAESEARHFHPSDLQ